MMEGHQMNSEERKIHSVEQTETKNFRENRIST